MKKTFILFFILFNLFNSYNQTIRQYFFDDRLAVNDSTSLILIVKNPQSQFAKNLNCRIYRDTTFIRAIKEKWFVEYDKSLGKSEHMCGWDMYFYSLSGSKMFYLNSLNSQCSGDKITPNDLKLLKYTGEPIKVERVERVSNFLNRKFLFNDNLIKAYYTNYNEWHYSKTEKYPVLYYNGYFKTYITLDSNFTVSQNVRNFLRTYTKNLDDINWNIPRSTFNLYTDKLDDFEKKNKPCKIEVYIYLKSFDFKYFPQYDIIDINYKIPASRELVLIYEKQL